MSVEARDEDNSAVPPPVLSAGTVSRHLSRARRAAATVSSFFLGQGAMLGVQFLTGFLLIRWLTIEQWAQFGIASGFQLAAASLMDMGITTTIIPLVGEHRDDGKLVGRYVRATRRLRNRAFWILSPLVGAAFLAMTYRHHWGWETQILLLASILLALYSTGRMSYYAAPLLLFGRLREYYVPQTISGILRLVACGVCRLAGTLNAWVAALFYALNMAVNGTLLNRRSAKYMEMPAEDDRSAEREVIQYILPAVPVLIFSAFQTQISLFLISFFGSTESVAQVAALGKIGQVFSVLMTFNVVVVEPYIARLDRRLLASRYLTFGSLGAAFCVPVVILAFAEPGLFLWILGPNYGSLRREVGWIVLAACISYVAGLLWIMNRARKWIFWRGTVLEIVLVFAVQIAFVLLFGVKTTSEAVKFNFATSLCYLATHAYIAMHGFLHGPKNLSENSRPVPELG